MIENAGPRLAATAFRAGSHNETLPRHKMILQEPDFRSNPIWIFPRVSSAGDFNVASKRTEIAIEKIVASCDGNIRGALEALLLVNEHLEAELHQLYAAASCTCSRNHRSRTMH
jgi:hypothetical protein